MNSSHKQRNKYYFKKDNIVGNQKFDYQTAENFINKNQFKNQNTPNRYLNRTTQNNIQQKLNDNLFKNMQKCTEKMQYYKLMGSLQEQKRTILEQQNNFLKHQNQELKQQNQSFKQQNLRAKQQLAKLQKQNSKISKKLKKLFQQTSEYREQPHNKHQTNINNQSNYKKQLKNHNQKKQLFIQIPNKSKHSTLNKRKNQKQRSHSIQKNQQGCQNCIQLFQKLNHQRQLYQKDRNYLKDQIQTLNQQINQNKKKQKSENAVLQNKNQNFQQRELELIEKFSSVQKALKNQLSSCYKALEQKYNLISQIERKLDFFESENHRIIKLLTILDPQKKINFKQKQNYDIKNRQRLHSYNNTKVKQNFNYETYLSDENLFPLKRQGRQNQKLQNHVQNKRKSRKYGSIKKIQLNQ